MSSLKYLSTDKAPKAIGPYSQAIIVGDFLYASGQIPIDPSTGNIVGDNVKDQCKRCCLNIAEILKEANTDFNHVVKTTCFLSDMSLFKDFNEVYGQYFTSKPARSCVAVKEIPKGVLCEIEITAYLK